MTLPAGLNLVTITGHFYGPDGTPLKGSIAFSPAAPVLTSSLYGSIVTGGASATLDNTGTFTITLLATNDPNVSPVGWTYTVTETINGSSRSYALALPLETSNVILSQIAPASASGGNYVVVTGPTGPQGAKGDPGYSVFNGTATPDNSTGKDGDVYLQYASVLYLGVTSTTLTTWVKADGSWVANANPLRGAAWYVNSGSTNSNTVSTGDMLLRTDTGDIYQKNASGWGSPAGNLWPGDPQPGDHGLAAWTFDPASCQPTAASLATGTLALSRIYLRATKALSAIWYGVAGAGASLTSGQCLLGIYDSTGTLKGSTVDQSTAMTTTGVKSAALTSSTTLVPGSYWVAFLCNGTTPPQMARGTNALLGLTNVNLSTSAYRFASYGTGLTALPNSITPGNVGNVTQGTMWAAIS